MQGLIDKPPPVLGVRKVVRLSPAGHVANERVEDIFSLVNLWRLDDRHPCWHLQPSKRAGERGDEVRGAENLVGSTRLRRAGGFRERAVTRTGERLVIGPSRGVPEHEPAGHIEHQAGDNPRFALDMGGVGDVAQ